jgi:hypothetical protein
MPLKRFRRALPAFSLAMAGLLAACATSALPPAARELPSDARERDRMLATFGRQLYRALASGHLDGVIADDRARDALLRPEVARRSSRSLAAGQYDPAAGERELWGSARYSGLCVQSGRTEPPAGVVGLRRSGFVFERGLLIGREAGGGELAGWVEGVFVLTEQGFVALEIERVETPRRDHSDLELAECELADHRGSPQDVVSGVGSTH